jgi:hypothetical protein
VHLRPIAFFLVVLVSSASCENSTDLIGVGGGGGGAVTQAEASGDWSFTVRKTGTLPCSGGSLADGQVLTAHVDVLTDGTVSGATSTWQNPPATVVRPLTGNVRLADGFSDFIFSAGTGSGAGMELRGTLGSSGTFSGTLTDPAPGLSPMFSVGGCEYTTTGTKA